MTAPRAIASPDPGQNPLRMTWLTGALMDAKTQEKSDATRHSGEERAPEKHDGRWPSGQRPSGEEREDVRD